MCESIAARSGEATSPHPRARRDVINEFRAYSFANGISRLLSPAKAWSSGVGENVVEVDADRLQRYTSRSSITCSFFITCGEEVLNGLFFRIAAFAHKFFRQVHEGIELGIWHRRIVLNGCNDFSGDTEKGLRYL
jgi:hypothetical protein